MKTHFSTTPCLTGRSPKTLTACGRSGRVSENVYRVDCLLCQKDSSYQTALAEAEAARQAAFEAQEPRSFIEPWQHDKAMECKSCGGNFFRMGDRTCYGHYENYHCASCGNVESRLTETGMSF